MFTLERARWCSPVLNNCHLFLFSISELFEVFDQEPILWCKEGVAMAVLATYTWSFLQFTLVFTATAETVPDTKEKPTVITSPFFHLLF